MTLTGKPLYAVLVILLVWLGGLFWAMARFYNRNPAIQKARLQLTLLSLWSSAIAVMALLALHISWMSVSLSQRMGSGGIRIIALFLFRSSLIGFTVSLAAKGKVRFVSLGICVVAGLWWFSLLMEAAI
jgi:hypothetical protein